MKLSKGTVVKYRNGKAYYIVDKDVEVNHCKDTVRIRKLVNLYPSNSTYSADAGALVTLPEDGNKEISVLGTQFEERRRSGLKDKHDVSKIIYNHPATIVYFGDGSKEVVKVAPHDIFDFKVGALLAVIKRLIGNPKKYNQAKKHIFEEIENGIDSIPAKDAKEDLSLHKKPFREASESLDSNHTPIRTTKPFYSYDHGDNIDNQPSVELQVDLCPRCRDELKGNENYCSKCGLKLDWPVNK